MTRMNNIRKVKNKNPAPVQITVEHIIREARQLHDQEELDRYHRRPNSTIYDLEELEDYLFLKRKEFEDSIQSKARYNKNEWVKYANWEERQKAFDRARSIWERVLDVDFRDHKIWLKYADFEIRNKFVNHARNVLDRAVMLLPRVDALWRKYIRLEQTLGHDAGARMISERWMAWKKPVYIGDRQDDEDYV